MKMNLEKQAATEGSMTAQYVKTFLGFAITALVAGAIYLSIVRGPAILIDMAAGAVAFLCM